ncbi:RNA pyrophosphohydrolase [Alphaproteobacteria bacterium SO-S41]|nr:RNA pyrophosphohydrolase [Alphaproteobacteria bacterium SO-S41]
MKAVTRPLHHRLAIQAARTLRPVQRLWWRIRRPTVMGACGLVVNAVGEWLLVRHTYMDGWHFPGGGVKTRESVLAAVQRELREEVGVVATALPVLAGVYTNPADPRSSHVALYRIDAYTMDPKPNLEIAEWRFFAPDALPADVGRGPRHRAAELAGTRVPDGVW